MSVVVIAEIGVIGGRKIGQRDSLVLLADSRNWQNIGEQTRNENPHAIAFSDIDGIELVQLLAELFHLES